jgi:hypothetical protein
LFDVLDDAPIHGIDGIVDKFFGNETNGSAGGGAAMESMVMLSGLLNGANEGELAASDGDHGGKFEAPRIMSPFGFVVFIMSGCLFPEGWYPANSAAAAGPMAPRESLDSMGRHIFCAQLVFRRTPA